MEERCVVCGEIVPEGRQVCPRCEADTGKTGERVKFFNLLWRTIKVCIWKLAIKVLKEVA